MTRWKMKFEVINIIGNICLSYPGLWHILRNRFHLTTLFRTFIWDKFPFDVNFLSIFLNFHPSFEVFVFLTLSWRQS